MTGRQRFRPAVDSDAEHREWLALTDQSGPCLTMPVLRRTWPSLDAVDKPTRELLAVAHAEGDDAWIDWVLTGLLEWDDRLRRSDLDEYAYTEPQHDATIVAGFALDDPDTDAPRLLGLLVPAGTHPYGRIKGEAWPATPTDRMALLCRHHGVELGLVTDGRWWALVWARRGGVTASCVFDSVTWPESADRIVVRAFRSLLHRRRFFAVSDDELLPKLFEDSGKDQEDVTDALGVQVRRAVEMLVDAIGRADLRDRAAGGAGLGDTSADEVYQAAVSVMMRTVFLLFAEERGLLPLDNPIYAAGYSASGLADELKQRADAGSEHELEHSHGAWRRLLALFTAVHSGVDHPRLNMPAYDGSIFDPDRHPWLTEVRVDDRAVLHMLRSVQYVVVRGESRRLSFQALDVEQIGYVYEGLLSFKAQRADDLYVGLIGRAGDEEEVRLADLERIGPDPAALHAAYKDSGIGSVTALQRRLTPLDEAQRTAARSRLLAVTEADHALVERLLPHVGVLREDLRGQPMVILPGSLFVTASSQRADTGTHYTPRFLAEQVVEGALEPLVYAPGPLQTADRTQWALRSSAEILGLRVADIAMGSGAFLVAACRYVAARLVEAWAEEGKTAAVAIREAANDAPADSEADPIMVEARRQVIQHCLYGVDINPMAVEMAKLSLWLVSMDIHRPFTFLDDRLLCGDSLLGIGGLSALHDVPDKRIHRDLDWARRLRRRITDLPDDTLDSVAEKQKLLAEATEHAERARLYADLVVGAALASVRASREDSVRIAERAAYLTQSLSGDDDPGAARKQVRTWLATDLPDGALDRQPLHWPIALPEVFDSGGFDAVVGNPPFLGGTKISGVHGSAYRNYLATYIAQRSSDRCDLVGHFVLRAHELVNQRGHTGLVATNTLAQGDTREVGLDQLLSRGFTIRRGIKSEPWPSKSAALQYCAIWACHEAPSDGALILLDGESVAGITTSLDPRGRVVGTPEKLKANKGLAFEGSKVTGRGFILEPAAARALLDQRPSNEEILFPYLVGADVNGRPDCSASRWIINFHDRTIIEAQTYPEVFEIVERDVKPERQRRRPDGSFVLRSPMPQRYWQYADKRPTLTRAVASLRQVIVITKHSHAVMPVIVRTGQVLSHALCVFASDDYAMLALLSSTPHYWWAIKRSSTLETRIRYTPSDVFETFPRPDLTEELRVLGERLHSYRRDVMLARSAGLTATYNLVHNPRCADDDVAELRRIHMAIDEAVARVYGWDDLPLDHDFHPTRQGVRLTLSVTTRQEILDRLLELNLERYAAEQAVGKTKQRGKAAADEQYGLF